MNLIDKLNWRYATKSFDPSKKISKSDLQYLKEAVRLSASSYGLQLYKVLIIDDSEVKSELRKAAWNQSQLTDAHYIFVFCQPKEYSDDFVDDYIHLTAETQKGNTEKLKEYGDSIKSSINKKNDQEQNQWMSNQVYLALSNLLFACADLNIDACPMEGFDNEAFDSILNLDKMKLRSTVIAPVGYRNAADHSQFRAKVRKPLSELFLKV